MVIEHVYPWVRSWGRTALEDRSPWMPLNAVAQLEKILKNPAKIFEFGSGGSTLFFASRGHRVVTVEHDPEWHQRISEKIAAEGFTNVESLLREPDPVLPEKEEPRDPSDPALDQSGLAVYQGFSFRSYVSAADRYPDGFFDLILVDGRARPGCIRHAAPKVCPGGHLVLDDARRRHYQKARALLSPPAWKGRMFEGLMPYPFQGLIGLKIRSFRGSLIGSTAIWQRSA